jgi:hypothetical protein
MSARDEITDIIYTYAERIDAGDFAGVAELLSHATLTFEGYDSAVTGPAAIEALYTSTTRRFDDGTPKTKHVMTNVIVEIGDDAVHASSKSYYTVLHAVPGEFALQPVIAGRYHDRFELVDGSWQLTDMHVIIDLMGDLSSHLQQEF